MTAFIVLGKYIVKSGGPDILNKGHVIEKGSLKSFISGKRYKRTKRAQQLLPLAMEVLHFQSFQRKQRLEYMVKPRSSSLVTSGWLNYIISSSEA